MRLTLRNDHQWGDSVVTALHGGRWHVGDNRKEKYTMSLVSAADAEARYDWASAPGFAHGRPPDAVSHIAQVTANVDDTRVSCWAFDRIITR